MQFNEKMGITPQTIYKTAEEILRTTSVADVRKNLPRVAEKEVVYEPDMKVDEVIQRLNKEMLSAAANLEFERAAILRDEIKRIQEKKMN